MTSLKTFVKTTLFTLLFILLSGEMALAEKKVYQYDGKLPFVQMMLNMMTVMGILDRLPNNTAYGNNRFSNNPLSPWSQYSNSATNSSALWGSPNWGVLPTESYSPNGSSWGSEDLSGWVNESWENSQWNPKAERQQAAKNQYQKTAPIVQNFSYNAPAMPDNNVAQVHNQSPLEKYTQQGQLPQRADMYSNDQAATNKNTQQSTKSVTPQKPCVTDFCGLKKPSLNGLWVAENGEMFGVKNNRYLWSDSKSRYLTGRIKMQSEYLFANIDGYDQLMKFKYKLAGNNLLTQQPNGELREFVRLSARQYSDLNRARGQNPSNYYYQ